MSTEESKLQALRLELEKQTRVNNMARNAVQQCIKDIQDVKLENRNLKAELLSLRTHFEHGDRLGNQSGSSASAAEKSSLQWESRDDSHNSLLSELHQLQERYDALFLEKEEAARTFKEYYRKWKNFKDWLVYDKEGSHVKPRGVVSRLQKTRARLRKAPSQSTHRKLEPFPNGHPSDLEPIVQDFSAEDPVSPGSKNPQDYEEKLNSDIKLGILSTGDSPAKKRHGKEKESDSTEGREFHSQHVVGLRHARRQLPGSDCECCRDYYNALDPLPKRDDALLWRTQSPREFPWDDSEDILDHKNEISRHRQEGGRPKTPPGYWNIGFPDTQEAATINKEAAKFYDNRLIMSSKMPQ